MLVAMSAAEPLPLLEHLSQAITACDGWVLRHGAVSAGCAEIDFEFPRVHAMDIYCLLVAAGVEFLAEAHQQLAELCQCTRQMDEMDAEVGEVPARVHISLYDTDAGMEFLGESGARTMLAA